MKDRVTIERRNTVMGLLGLALSAWLFGLFGFAASPAMALSITDTDTDIVGGSLGTTGSTARGTRVTADGFVGDFAKYLPTHWAAAFPTTSPATVSLSADDHAFLFIDGKLGLDDGGVKAIGAPGATAAALTGKQRLDLFFADAHVRQSGPEPARLLLFGATLVGLGAAVRRRMRGAVTPSI